MTGYDPCREGAAGVSDIGAGVRIRMTSYRGMTAGLIYSHPRPDGERCSGAATFDLIVTIDDARPRWRVLQRHPLTLEQSLLCLACGHHGWIRNGRWIPA